MKSLCRNYTLEERMMGLDLHGLSCRIPEPTKEQSKCSHTTLECVTESWEDWMTGETVSEEKHYEVSTYEDIPGTNNLRCKRCGYTRRY